MKKKINSYTSTHLLEEQKLIKDLMVQQRQKEIVRIGSLPTWQQ
jgi:hypothetical protein